MIIRRYVALGATVGAVAWPLGCAAQQSVEIHRVAVLVPGGPTATKGGQYIEKWKDSLRDLGYVEGRNVIYEIRWAQGDLGQLNALAVELVATKPAVIFAPLPAAAHAAKAATNTIPIVTASVSDPIGEGLVSNLAHPDGNLTGVVNIVKDLRAKHVELIRAVVPRVKRIAVLLSESRTHTKPFEDFRAAAASVALEAIPVWANSPREFDAAFAAMARERADAAIALGGQLQFDNAARIVDLAAKAKLPVVYPFRHYAEEGGLMSYGPSTEKQYELAAQYVDKILRGSKPQDLPIQQPTQLELVINMRAAKALSITIPQSLLLRADRIIE
jgi:putative ABC transport system substrate-binding protein